MKIAITNAFLPSDERSGVPYQVHHLANALVAAGHDVTAFSFSPRPADATYSVHQYPRPRVKPHYFPFFMAYQLARTDFSPFDIVHANGDNYLLRTTTPVLRTFYGSALDEMKAARALKRKLFFAITVPLESIGARMADHVVGISEDTQTSIPRVETVIPCGVNLEAFTPGMKTPEPTILFVGTEEGRKRGAWLADMFKTQILPVLPSAELRMVSDRVATEPGIHRYGRVSAEELAGLYRSSWVFCLPSTYEGFGVPYIEAMASHTAVVATSQNPGAKEVLDNGSYGAFVDDEKLATTLCSILTNVSLRDDLVRRGSERTRSYEWPTVVSKYEAAYAAAIQAKRRHP